MKFSDGTFMDEAAGSQVLSLQSADAAEAPDKEFDGEVKVRFESVDSGEHVPRR